MSVCARLAFGSVVSFLGAANLMAGIINVPGDQPTIQLGIDAAQDGDTVLVAPGTYVEIIDFRGKPITVKSSGGSAVTTIDGNHLGSVVAFLSDEDPQSVLEGFTLVNGSGTPDPTRVGGGMFCKNASPTIRDVTITQCSAQGAGGGLCGKTSSAIIENCRFIGNQTNGPGGGLAFINSSPQITSCVIARNKSKLDGGGVYCQGHSARIADSEISENATDASGGGITCLGDSMVVSGNRLERNLSGGNSSIRGGGGLALRGSQATVDHNLIAFNQTALVSSLALGGGMFLQSGSGIVVTNNTIVRNVSAGTGGGIGLESSVVTATNNTLSGNAATIRGGGLDAISSDAVIANGILWGDQAPADPEISLASSTIEVSFSNVQGGWVGQGNLDGEPKFVDAAADDFHLFYYSPCVSAGDDAAPSLPASDFEGDPRPSGGRTDMGADEWHPHLYITGDTSPGKTVRVKIIAPAFSGPTFLLVSDAILDPPMPSDWGDLYLEPPVTAVNLGFVPYNGLLQFAYAIPPSFSVPTDVPQQALVENRLTNLWVAHIE